MKRSSMQTASSQPAGESGEMFMRRPISAITRVVVGVDGSSGAAAAVCWAAAEACQHQAMLRIVSAWDELDQAGPAHDGDPAGIAAARVQKALVRVLGRSHYPRRIACVTPRGRPGPALLAEAGGAGLLVLGVARVSPVLLAGRVNRYCLRSGHGPLVFVPAPPSDDVAGVVPAPGRDRVSWRAPDGAVPGHAFMKGR